MTTDAQRHREEVEELKYFLVSSCLGGENRPGQGRSRSGTESTLGRVVLGERALEGVDQEMGHPVGQRDAADLFHPVQQHQLAAAERIEGDHGHDSGTVRAPIRLIRHCKSHPVSRAGGPKTEPAPT